MKRSKFPKEGESENTRVLQRVRSDVAGRIKPQSIGGRWYVVTIVDDFSNFLTAYPMKKEKSEVLHAF